MASAIQKPCEVPCPKCGSADIARRLNTKGEVIRSVTYGKQPNEYVTGIGTYNWTVEREHIHNHCRSCQYGWATLPLTTARNGEKERK